MRMKKIFTFLLISLLSTSMFGQLMRVIDFEEAFSDTAWVPFGNGADTINPDIEIIENPLKDGINTSDSVLAYYVKEDAVRWNGAYSDYDVLTSFTDEAYTLGMMVHKQVISPTRLKVELSLNDGADKSVEVVNSVTDEWELLKFDFSEAIGYLYERFTFFPDFPAEDREVPVHTVLIDNIMNVAPDNTTLQEGNGFTLELWPTPAEYRMAVSYPGLSEIAVYDIMGKQLKHLKFSPRDSKVIETGDLKSGIYLLTAVSGNERISVKFVKK